jgi:hypothetical protein
MNDSGDDHHLVRARTPGHEREHLGALRVEPLDIVGQDQDGLVRGYGREQAERGERGQEQFRPRPVGQAECGQQRPPVDRPDPADALQHRVQQLVEASEGKLRLGFDPDRGQHAVSGRARRTLGRAEQRRLADSRFTEQHKGPALGKASAD